MCRACSRPPKGANGQTQSVEFLPDIIRACKEGQKAGLPYWLAPVKKRTLRRSPVPKVAAVVPVPSMTSAQLKAELGRQARRLAGHVEGHIGDQWQERGEEVAA